jgi:hypothetical protein
MTIINSISSPTPALVTTVDSTGNLAFQVAGTNAVTYDNNQNATHTGSISSVNTFGYKNRLINGLMNIWQRGTSVTLLSVAYLADRWCTHLFQVARHQRVAVSSAPAGLFAKYALRASSSTTSEVSGGTRIDLNQTIESINCQDLSGLYLTAHIRQ